MKNPRITKKEQNLLKGAIRRVFSRSELRKALIDKSLIKHTDPSRPRVTRWSMCRSCLQPTPTYLMQVDHIEPIIPINNSLDDFTWDDIVNRIWCDESNLTPICKACHTIKTKAENKARRMYKKEKKKNEG